MLTPNHLHAIEARLAAATPGPWKAYNHQPIVIEYGPGDHGGFELTSFRGTKDDFADADLIAHAPADLRALLDEVQRLRIELATYTDEARRSESGEWRCERCDEWQPMCATNAGIECDMCVECAEECRAIEITP